MIAASWIYWCAALNVLGWGLSACHCLNRAGYVVGLLVAAGGWLMLQRQFGNSHRAELRRTFAFRRWRRWLPAAYGSLAALALLGGLLHAPNNYDGLAYRVPRVLHWLAAGEWHWIHTSSAWLNTRTCGYEWVTAPILLFTKTDRGLFLVGFISYLLLPGLIFSTFVRLGVRRVVAWHWMWMLPAGLGFILQAGGIANDIFGVVFPLAALNFALRTRGEKPRLYLFLTILAAALATSSKPTNIPLLLPCTLALLPGLRSLRPRLADAVPLALALIVGGLASCAPNVALNLKYCGDWTGNSAEDVVPSAASPGIVFLGNALNLTAQNLVPPVFPFFEKWNQGVLRVMPTAVLSRLEKAFPAAGAHLNLGPLENEESSGLGLVTMLLLMTSGFAAWRRRGKDQPADWLKWAVRWSPYVGLVVYMLKTPFTPSARLILPYYPLLVAPWLMGRGHGPVVHSAWWRAGTVVVWLVTVVVLILQPARPLGPAQWALSNFGNGGATGFQSRLKVVYETYARRSDVFGPITRALPPEARVVGFISYREPETSLWRPFGRHRVVHILPKDAPASWRGAGVEYVALHVRTLEVRFGCTFQEWLDRTHAVVLQRFQLRTRAAEPESEWVLAKFTQ